MATVSFAELLDKYKTIYFDASYYWKEKAAAYNVKQENGRTNWTVADFSGLDAWTDFSTPGTGGAFYQKADGTIGINPSKYFDVSRYYQDKGGVTATDAISDYTQFVIDQYKFSDPADRSMPVTPTMVTLTRPEIDSLHISSFQPMKDLAKSDDGFISSLQYTGCNWNWVGLEQGNVLYYSFDTNMSWVAANGYDWGEATSTVTTYKALDSDYYDDCQTVFSMLTDITGIVFQQTLDPEQSNIHFFGGELTGSTVGITYSRTSSSSQIEKSQLASIVLEEGREATAMFGTIAHEIGHALGLSHPFDKDTGVEEFGSNTYNHGLYTIMSYTAQSSRAVYGPRDILALQYLYGTDGLNGTEGLVYFNRPTSGDDSLTGNDSGENINGLAGNDTIRGLGGDDYLYGGTGNDSLEGGEGNDYLSGGADNDTLTGGAGNDTFIINKGDGHDVITDATTDDILRLGAGITQGDLKKVTVSGNDVVLTIGDSGDQSITLQNWNSTNGLQNVTLNNGSKVNLLSLLPHATIETIGALSVDEAGLRSADSVTDSATLTIKAPAGVDKVEIDGVTVYQNNAVTKNPVTTAEGQLTVTAFDAATGTLSYQYELTGSAAHAGKATLDRAFKVSVTDKGEHSAATGTIALTIKDDAPTAAYMSKSVTEGQTAAVTGTVLDGVVFGADGAPGDPVTWATTAAQYGSITRNTDGTFSYTLDNDHAKVKALTEGKTLTETFGFTVKDKDGSAATAQLTVTINGKNDDVTITPGPALTVAEANLSTGTNPNASALTQNGSLTITAPDGLASVKIGAIEVIKNGALTATTSVSDASGVLEVTGFDASTGKLGYSYTLNKAGDATKRSFTLTAIDTDNTKQTADIVVNITDDAPTAMGVSKSVTEGQTTAVTGTVLDGVVFGADGVPGDPVTWATTAAQYGSITRNTDGTFSYTLDNDNAKVRSLTEGESLTETFGFTVKDSDGSTATAQLTVTINGKNNDVTITPGAALTVAEANLPTGANPNASALTQTGSLIITAPDGLASVKIGATEVIRNGALTTTTSVSDASGVLKVTGFDASTGKLGYSYTLNKAGADTKRTFTLTAIDADNTTATGAVTINITDDAPTAADVSKSVTEGVTAAPGPVTGKVTDGARFGADGAGSAPVSWATATARYGSITQNADGAFSYTLDNENEKVRLLRKGETLTEDFNFTVTDSDGSSSAPQTLTITIEGQAVRGTTGNDGNLVGAAGDDSVFGYAGNDTLRGEAGNDTLDGGVGNDTLDGGDGNDYLYGDAGDDTLNGGAGENRLYGGDGNDTLLGGGDNDYLRGNLGADSLVGGAGHDSLRGDEGDDFLDGGVGDDSLRGDAGRDRLLGGAGDDTLRGGDDDDTLSGGAENDFLRGDGGNDLVFGDDGQDRLFGDDGNDSLLGGAGDDSLFGDEGDDTLKGELGRDRLYGGDGNDRLYGGGGRDYLEGNAGNDFLRGQANNDRLFGAEGADSLFGDAGDDSLFGEADDDRLYGGDGSDTLDGGAGNDFLRGGNAGGSGDVGGNDLLYGREGNDSLFGDAGDDTLYGGVGHDVVYGGADNDFLYGEAGDDTLKGQDGNDFLDGGAGADRLSGGTGKDTLNGGADNDTLFGEAGTDSLDGGEGDDKLYGGDGNDTLTGGNGADFLRGGNADGLGDVGGNDLLSGGAGNDSLFGDAGNDTLSGGEGNDLLYGGEGQDTLSGEAGDDTLKGQDGDDFLDGGAGNDFLRGGADNDRLFGGAGEDRLFGDEGNDTLSGGAGNDLLSGGAGRNTFHFDTTLNASANVDVIADFKSGEDTISLGRSIFAKLSVGALSAANFRASADGLAADNNDFILYNTATGALLYDADGNGSGAAVQFATLQNKAELKAEDFVVVA